MAASPARTWSRNASTRARLAGPSRSAWPTSQDGEGERIAGGVGRQGPPCLDVEQPPAVLGGEGLGELKAFEHGHGRQPDPGG
jgi:hypothetical protein